MPKFLIKWKINTQMLPNDTEERLKILQSMNKMVKEKVKSGFIMDFGEYCDRSGGYAIVEGDDITELSVVAMKWWPYVDFDAKPVLTIDQVIETINRTVAEMKGK